MRVCAACIEDPALQEVVKDNLTELRCDYCEREENQPIACRLDVITDYMRPFIEEKFCDPADELPYDSAEGGYQGNCIDSWDLLESFGLLINNSDLFNDISDAFTDHDWCQRDYYSLSVGVAHRAGWDHFCQIVKNKRRFTFWKEYDRKSNEYDEEVIHPAQMLPTLEELIGSNVIIEDTGTRFWRVQLLEADEVPNVASRFTSPPIDKAFVPNRMTPAGISMFYGAEELSIAYDEVVSIANLDEKVAWGVQFEAVIPLNLLDLATLPTPRSAFTHGGYESRELIGFLHHFRDSLMRPINRDGHEHIDYVPTQVFTEYVRYEMKTVSGESFHGIRYLSSKAHKPCYVIFAGQQECLDDIHGRKAPQLLRCVPETLTKCRGPVDA